MRGVGKGKGVSERREGKRGYEREYEKEKWEIMED